MLSRLHAAVLCALLCLCSTAWAVPLEFTAVHSIDSPANAPPADSQPWQPRTLPDRWSDSGRQAAGSVWYRIQLPLAATDAPMALWLPLLSMNAELWLGGRRVVATTDGAEGRTTRHWNRPWLVAIPRTESLPVTAHLRVQASAINEGVLAPPWYGPMADLRARHDALLFWRVTVPGWGVVFGMSLGLVFMLIRLRDAEQQAWGYFGAGAMLWSIANLNLTAVHMPVADSVVETAVHVTLFLGLLCLVLFGLSFSRALTQRMRRWLWLYGAAACPLLVWTALRADGRMMMVLMLPLLLCGGYAMTAIVRHSRSHRWGGGALFAAVMLLTLLAACHDWVSRVGWLSLDRPFLLPLAAPLMLTALAWLLASDYAQVRADLARTNLEIDEQLKARERELAQIYAQKAQAQSELAVVQERARILRDMHDGAGAHLSTAIRIVEAAGHAPGALEQTLHDALDQLKLSIDALTLPPGDVVALLASVRYRLTSRLEQAGIALCWDIDDVPNWPAGKQDRAMQHLQFIVFEIVSNVLQHAHATRLRVGVRQAPGAIVLEFVDNGRGIENGGEPNLKSLRARCQLIDATLEMADARPGLTLRLLLPLIEPVYLE
jgi:signal transduction histidine kinase